MSPTAAQTIGLAVGWQGVPSRFCVVDCRTMTRGTMERLRIERTMLQLVYDPSHKEFSNAVPQPQVFV